VSKIESLRWRVAKLMDKVPGQCWSSLADWAGDWKDYDRDNRRGLPWRPQDWACRRDAQRVGSCYCNKLQCDDATAAVFGAHRPDPLLGILTAADRPWARCSCGWRGDDIRVHIDAELDRVQNPGGVL
jgi:hypothetical protein